MMRAIEIAALPENERRVYLSKLGRAGILRNRYDWRHWAREAQLPPTGIWTTWLLLCGRGWGKTRTGAEFFRAHAESHPNGVGVLVGQTPGDARDVMIRGRSGLLSITPPWDRPAYEPSNLTLRWRNGFTAHIRSAFNPEKLRGLGAEVAWLDELAAWPADNGREAYQNLMLSLREGADPKAVITTTPKPVPLLREIIADAHTAITRGSSFENRANLSPKFFEAIVSRYQGTKLGRQELFAELLDEIEGALWTHDVIDKARVAEAPELVRAVVGVDPSGGVAETGIVGAGVTKGGDVYVLDDASLRGSPSEWADAVIGIYQRFRMDRVVAERNYGGDMVRSTIEVAARESGEPVAFKAVTATRGKVVRAEPVAALYEQGKVHHVGTLPQLEGELTSWTPGDTSPNRLDALVWALTELVLSGAKPVETVRVEWG